MPILRDRQKGMIWGQFIGDAAALGTHWIYDLKELDKRHPKGVQGFETPLPTDYHAGKRSGQLTHYGVAALELLRSMSACQGFSHENYGARFVEAFASPDYHGYIDRTARDTITNYHEFLEDFHPDLPYTFQDGSNNDEIGCATHLAPVLAVYWEDEDLFDVVEAATKVTQNNEYAVAYMIFHARIVHKILQGDSLDEIFQSETLPAPHDTPIDTHIRQKISRPSISSPYLPPKPPCSSGRLVPCPKASRHPYKVL